LTGAFLKGLSGIKDIKIYGRKDIFNRAPVVSIDIEDRDLSDIAYILDNKYGIQTRVGLHCAPIAHQTLGTYPRGTIRFSFGHNNDLEEIEYCLHVLKEIIYGI
jgi:cysteine desulfurase family protein